MELMLREIALHRLASMNSRLLPILLSVALLGGCESVADATSGVRERLSEREAAKARTFAVDPRAGYEAVRTAATQMG